MLIFLVWLIFSSEMAVFPANWALSVSKVNHQNLSCRPKEARRAIFLQSADAWFAFLIACIAAPVRHYTAYEDKVLIALTRWSTLPNLMCDPIGGQKMKSALRLFAASALALTAATLPATAQTEWKFNNSYAPTRTESAFIRDFVENVNKSAAGKFKINLLEGGAMGLRDVDALRWMQDGTPEMGFIWPPFLGRDAPDLASSTSMARSPAPRSTSGRFRSSRRSSPPASASTRSSRSGSWASRS